MRFRVFRDVARIDERGFCRRRGERPTLAVDVIVLSATDFVLVVFIKGAPGRCTYTWTRAALTRSRARARAKFRNSIFIGGYAYVSPHLVASRDR